MPIEEESLTALEWVRLIYHYILLLLARRAAEPRPPLLDRARSIVAVVAEQEAAGRLPWLDRLCRSPEAQAKAEVAVVAVEPLTPSVKQAFDKRAGRPVRRLLEDRSLLQLSCSLAELWADWCLTSARRKWVWPSALGRSGYRTRGAGHPCHRRLSSLTRRVST